MKERIVYQCDYCGEHKAKPKILFSKYLMARHEEKCFYNPKNKTCCTCIYNDYLGECGDKPGTNNCLNPSWTSYPMHTPRMHCPLWIAKMTLFLMLLLIVPCKQAKAFDEPIAGIAPIIEDVSSADKAIAYYSAIYGVDAKLVNAIIGQESGGNTKAIGKNKNGSTDHGLMQINSCNHEWLRQELGITDFYNPSQNIQAGCYILGLLSSKYTNVHRILMCYNMGETQTRKLWRQGIRSSKYSREVIKKYQKLKKKSQ